MVYDTALRMAPTRADVLRILNGHVGRENAIKANELAYALGQNDDRHIRQLIRALLKDGYPIAASNTEPMGYYIVANRVKAEEYLAVLRSRLIEDALRRRDFKKAAANWFEPARQMTLRLE